MAAMEKICEDYGIDQCKINKYVEYNPSKGNAYENKEIHKCKNQQKPKIRENLEEDDSISGYGETIGYFKKRILKIEFL